MLSFFLPKDKKLFKYIFVLALPVIISNTSRVLMGVVDLIMIGHSGGAFSLATINSRIPKLIDKTILISCPCNFEKWRKMKGESVFKLKTSPHRNTNGISNNDPVCISFGTIYTFVL